MAAHEFYRRTAEMVAVLLPHAWTGLGPALTAAVAGLDTADGPVLDVGAGSGEGVRAVAGALPTAEIVAVEPDSALRTALLAVVGADPDLRARVTVREGTLATAELPERVSAVLLMNVLGHLSPDQRIGLWGLLAERLTGSGRAVLTLYPPTRPERVPDTAMAETRIGRRRYLGRAGAEPAGPDAIIWEMSYQVLDGDTPVTAFSARDHWWVVGPDELADELAPHALRITETDPEQFLYTVTRQPAATGPSRRAGRTSARSSTPRLVDLG